MGCGAAAPAAARQGRRTLAQFAYQVDRRGNRTQATEYQAHPATTSDRTIAYNDAGITYRGPWADAAPFKTTSDFSASLSFLFGVNTSAPTPPQFTYGTDSDHGIFDVYIGGTLWQTFDGYSANPGEQTVALKLEGEGPFTFELRNRAEKHISSSGYTLRFKQLVVADVSYDMQTLRYTYDGLSRC